MSIDPVGNPVAAGRVAAGKDGGDFTVIKLRSADGSPLWVRGIPHAPKYYDGMALAVAVDSAGNVVATGQILDPITYVDFAVLYVPNSAR